MSDHYSRSPAKSVSGSTRGRRQSNEEYTPLDEVQAQVATASQPKDESHSSSGEELPKVNRTRGSVSFAPDDHEFIPPRGLVEFRKISVIGQNGENQMDIKWVASLDVVKLPSIR